MKTIRKNLLTSLTTGAATAVSTFAIAMFASPLQAKIPNTETPEAISGPIRIEITIEDNLAIEAIKTSEKAEVPQATMVVIQPGQENQNIKIKMSTRGLTSLAKFSRKNFNIKSKDDQKIQIGQIKGKALVLSASPEDILGTKNKFAYKMLMFAGIRSFNPQYAEVVINGLSRGLYFVTKSADDEILKATDNEAECVVRRRYADKIEEKGHDKDLDKNICDKYVSALTKLHKKAEKLKGQELLDTLSKTLNLEAYMKWIALNYLLKNGDYSDEVFFFGKILGKGTPNEKLYFDILPWDNDDIDSASAHFAGIFGSPNHGRDEVSRKTLIRSFESSLDKAIAKDPVMLRMFFDVASRLMNDLAAKSAIQHSVRSLIAELTPYLENQDIMNAGVEDSVRRPHNRNEILQTLNLRIIDTQLQMAKMNQQLAENAGVDIEELTLNESSIRSFFDKAFMSVVQWATEVKRRPVQIPNPLYQ
ncbi:MAG: CotH kinase family protein [Bdellovibrionaceae bacterium]|nr:CotH kinase family protein [Pseudobdellovibrionaceae bacterium]